MWHLLHYFKIDDDAKEAWRALFADLQDKLLHRLKSKTSFCKQPINPQQTERQCMFCKLNRTALEAPVPVTLKEEEEEEGQEKDSIVEDKESIVDDTLSKASFSEEEEEEGFETITGHLPNAPVWQAPVSNFFASV